MSTSKDFANELQKNVLMIELDCSHVGRSRRLSQRHNDDVADHLAAKRGGVSGSKKLYPPGQAIIKRLGALTYEARKLWIRYTIGYRDGRRLLQRSLLDEFSKEMAALQDEVHAVCMEADENRDTILAEAREFLGEQLFDINEYPSTFVGSVNISWSVANFRPPEEWLHLAPETYDRECKRVTAMFETAVLRYEDECREELASLVESLTSKLSEEADTGKKVVYKESAANNLREFFERFKMMGITSDSQLTDLVKEAEQALGGTTMSTVKKSRVKRDELKASFGKVSEKLGALLVDAPSRSIDLEGLED